MQIRDHFALETALECEEIVRDDEGVGRRQDARPDELGTVDDIGFEILDVISKKDGWIPEAKVAEETALDTAIFGAGQDDAVGSRRHRRFLSCRHASVATSSAEIGRGGSIGFAEDPFWNENASRAWRAAADTDEERKQG